MTEHNEKSRSARLSFLLLLMAGLLLRVLLAASNQGFSNDTACFAAWAERMYAVGPAEFYSPDSFTDYPPGFMYILYLIGAARSIFQIPSQSWMHLLLLKFPAILCDLACCCLLYREACRRCPWKQALWITAAYLFNPAIILNSSLWGQVDSVFTLAISLFCLYLIREKMLSAYIVFGVGVLLKPQTLVFTPVLLAGMLNHIFLREPLQKCIRRLAKNLLQGALVLSGMGLLCLPFGLGNVLAQYTDTLGSYPYAAVNAYNFWALLGKSWVSQDNTFFALSYAQWGILVILLIVAFTFLINICSSKTPAAYPFLGAFCILTMFVFSVRMHERYLYPGLLLLLLCCLYHPCKELYLCYGGFSLLHFCNTAHVLFFYDPQNYEAKDPVILLISAGMMVGVCYFYYVLVKYCRGTLQPRYVSSIFKGGNTSGTGNTTNPANASAAGKNSLAVSEAVAEKHPQDARTSGRASQRSRLIRRLFKPLPPVPSAPKVPFTRPDMILLTAIILLYSIFALYDLGDRFAPVTAYTLSEDDGILLDFGEHNSPAVLSCYLAPWHGRTFTLETRNHPSEEWRHLGSITLENVFTWQDIPLNGAGRYLQLTLEDTQASLLELTFSDAGGGLLVPRNAEQYPGLFDESDLHPAEYTFRNSMYFDEIYHARTAYEYLNGLYSYENTHPPLGKLLIAAGIAVLGMNPFGWRITGVLFGIAMLPFLYLLGKKMTRNIQGAALSCFLFAFDFMHFTQTRIATIDVYITFFVIAMYYYMYCYSRLSFYTAPLKHTLLPLGLCGVAMGFGIACKWTGVYAGVGLALLFAVVLARRLREYLYAKEQPQGVTNGISHAVILERFLPYAKKTILFCLVFFVAVPLAIYTLSYLPFVDGSGSGLLERMVQNQLTMYNYHSNLEATHYFASSWYEWPIMVRPVWYYSHVVNDTAGLQLREGISSFGNPLVWWAGIPAFFYMVYLLAKSRKYENTAVKTFSQTASSTEACSRGITTETTVPAFLIISYLAQYLPWCFITRITFIYHYFPSVAFVVLMIVYSLIQLKKRISNRAFAACVIVYGAAAFGLFLLFYPVLSGQPVSLDFVEKWLRWGKDWVLVAN